MYVAAVHLLINGTSQQFEDSDSSDDFDSFLIFCYVIAMNK